MFAVNSVKGESIVEKKFPIPRVSVDGVAFENPYFRGIWRYGYNVLSQLRDQVRASVLLRTPAQMPLPVGATGLIVRPQALRRYQLLARARQWWERRNHSPSPAVPQASVYHSTFYTVSDTAGIPQVTTVYDMMQERFFHICVEAVFPMIETKKAAIRAADICVCISQATASDLVRFYPNVASRVRVIHLGCDHVPVAGDRTSAVPSKYALFVGERFQYKNFSLVLYAMMDRDWPASLDLRVVGRPFYAAEEALIHSLGLSNRVKYVGRVDDAELWNQYRAANCFIFPSLVEGFGLPVLEAQANRTPLICSDTSVFREVASEDGATYFDPRRAESLSSAVRTVQEPEVRRRTVAAGIENVSKFTWVRCARETLSVYQEVQRLR